MTFECVKMSKHRKITPGVFLLLAGVMVFGSRDALAHPMGNFSISHFAGLRIERDAVDIRYILDLAEIPTFQEMQTTGILPVPADPRVVAYLASKAEALKGGLIVTLNGRPLSLETVTENVIFPPGAGDLPTMKIGVVYRAPFSNVACPCKLEYRDGNFPERAGWKEVVSSAGPGVAMVLSTAAEVSRSQELANYPTDLINSPPQDLSAHLTFTLVSGLAAAGNSKVDSSRTPSRGLHNLGKAPVAVHPLLPAGEGNKFLSPLLAKGDSTVGERAAVPTAPSSEKLTLAANKQGTPRNSFTELITSNGWGLWFMLTAALIAAALGGLHALEPGHGKTIVAAYLVGSQGTAAHALLLGLIVTVTHTAGVYALGLVTLYASKYIVPDHLYPWLGIASGLSIAILGLYMLRRRLAGHGHAHGHHHHHGLGGHSHDTGHSHPHTHDHTEPGHAHPHEHTHEHPHDHPHDAGYSHGSETQFSYRQLVTLGVTGGIVPCPAALVVLLSAISLHRVAFGLYLIVAFSLGLAAVLISIGMITVYARRVLARLPTDGPLINRWLPTASATAITCLGVGIAAQALLTLGVIHIPL
jgi:ABC-type nickel/cobalt efflux system permease component RcnA